MSLRIISKGQQAYGQFNSGQIIENKPIGFPQDGGFVRPYSNLFYWARAEAVIDSTIGLHPHRGFEIMSFVLEGTIEHYDTKTDEWIPLNAGDAQIIRAGNGISHAEKMNKGSVMFQIWVDPNLQETLQKAASYNDYADGDLPREDNGELITKTYIGSGSPFTLETEKLKIRRHQLKGKKTFSYQDDEVVSVYVIGGGGSVNDQSIEQDDFAISEGGELQFDPYEGGLDLFEIISPIRPSYPTYYEAVMTKDA